MQDGRFGSRNAEVVRLWDVGDLGTHVAAEVDGMMPVTAAA